MNKEDKIIDIRKERIYIYIIVTRLSSSMPLKVERMKQETASKLMHGLRLTDDIAPFEDLVDG